MYDAATVKKAYYHKKATPDEKKTLERHLDRHHGMNNWRKPVKEELELDEAFINGREYASQGVMHPDHAKMHKVGDSRDFYAHGTGDKLSGKVTKNDGKEVHIQADKTSGGKTHKFKVTPHLPKQQNEAVKPVNVDKVNAAGQEPHEEKWEPAKKKMKKESVSFSDFLKQLDEIKMADLPGRKIQGKSYGANYEDPEGAFETKDDMKKAEPKKAGRKLGQKVGARANLGNSKLHRA
jgi:predicted CopG family antitoxin